MNLIDVVQAVFTIFAFGLSVYATYKTVKFNQRQNEMAEVQDRLNKLLLRKETNEALDSFKAELGVNFIKFGNNNTKFKVFNKGRGTARNVRLGFPEGNEIIVQSDIDSKFPLESMEQHQSVELIAVVYMQSPRKVTVELIWDDDTGLNQSKLLYPTL